MSTAWRLRDNGWIDFVWSRQDTEFDGIAAVGARGIGVTIDHVHDGASYRPDSAGTSAPFVAATLGLSSYRVEAPGFDDDLALSLALHGGADFAVGPSSAIRLAGRGWLTFDGSALTGMCGTETCEVRIETGSGLQLEVLAGLVVRCGAR